jgi:nitrate/nitrite transport system permease protein
MKTVSIKVRGAIVSCAILVFCLFLWHVATAPKNVPKQEVSQGSSEYSALMGQGGGQQVQKTGFAIV